MADPWATYFWAMDGLTVVTGLVILISALDDVCIDAYFWLRTGLRKVGRRRPAPVSVEHLRTRDERFLAIMVPAWKEYSVIAHMVENTLATLDYHNYMIFIGCYPNDVETTAQVDHMVRRHPNRVRRAAVPHNGPTCKADCLNWILREIADHEADAGLQFAGVILHDCEDVIHPLEFKYFNDALDTSDLIQMPVMSLELPWHAFVAGTYLDDFSEVHQKDLTVREGLTGLVPGAGVGLCYSRRAVAAMTDFHHGHPFNTDTLTEDYDFSFRLANLGMKASFAGVPVPGAALKSKDRATTLKSWWKRPATSTGLLATREYFPKTFKAAYRQRARWVLGISFLGWQQLGWPGSWLSRYMFVRDRKGIVTALFSIAAYFLLANLIGLRLLKAQGLPVPAVHGHFGLGGWLEPILLLNMVLLGNRLLQRFYFVSRLNGIQQGLMSLPRNVVNNFINFFAVCRAWRIFAVYLVTHKPIAWDKTAHTYPVTSHTRSTPSRIGEMLVQVGTITTSQRDEALAMQRGTGMRLGQVLLAKSFVSVESLADTIAEQADLPRVNLSSITLDASFDAIPRDLIERHQVVPFSTGEDKSLNVAVTCLPDDATTRALCAAAGRRISYFIACDHEVDAVVTWLRLDLARTSGGTPLANEAQRALEAPR
jgi:adsorption protein B